MRYRKLKIAGRTLYEHRVVAACAIGRDIDRREHVHHKNGDPLDNRQENLEILSPREHTRKHLAKNPIVKTCEACGRSFEPPQAHRKRDRACSMPCRDVLTRAELVSDLAARLGNAREVDVTLQWLLTHGLLELSHRRSAGRSSSYTLTSAGAAW